MATYRASLMTGRLKNSGHESNRLWKLSFARDGRIDIAEAAARAAAKAIADYEEEAGWKVIFPAGTK